VVQGIDDGVDLEAQRRIQLPAKGNHPGERGGLQAMALPIFPTDLLVSQSISRIDADPKHR
jgi:hypothetical protein